MDVQKKITVIGVIKDGVGIGLKNLVSLLVATLLWFITLWIPYLNVGTTIAMMTIPIELSKGEIISPTFIFDEKYRKYMGEFFTLIGLMMIAIIPASFFMLIPACIIFISWSLAIFIMIDKEISPSEALIQSNKATYGYKWTIFFTNLAVTIPFLILISLFIRIPFLGPILSFCLILILLVTTLGCTAVIYKNLTTEKSALPIDSETPDIV